MVTNIKLLSISLFSFYIHDVLALKNMHIRVPEIVRIGDSVTLACDYDLESATLYTIKWYQNDEEFYRFVPKESPPSQVFAVPHLNVDVSKSNSKEVILNDVERKTSGEFKCEVTADAPSFHTDIRVASLLVADVPEDGPVLRTDMQKIIPGDEIRANCTSAGSYPSMNITWFVNNVVVHSSGDIHIQESVFHFDSLPGLETLVSTISLRTTSDLFKRGKLKLRCSATLFALYSLSREIEIQEDTGQQALIMKPTTFSNTGASCTFEQLRLEVLMISFLSLAMQ